MPRADERQVAVGDARPVVAHLDDGVADGNLDQAGRRAPLPRVVEQVRNRPLDPLGNADDNARLERRLEAHAARTAGSAIDRGLHNLVESELARRDVRLLAARELDELFNERRHRLQLVPRVVHEAGAILRSEQARIREQLDVRPQRRERRTQFMRRIRDELSL
jgi:hypothetical protein